MVGEPHQDVRFRLHFLLLLVASHPHVLRACSHTTIITPTCHPTAAATGYGSSRAGVSNIGLNGGGGDGVFSERGESILAV